MTETNDPAADFLGGRIQKSPILSGGRCVYCGTPADLVCQACEKKNDSVRAKAIQEKAERKFARRLNAFEESFGIYADTDRDRLPDTVAARAAASWNHEGDRGLLIVGPGQTGKTRSASLIAKRALERGQSVEFISAPDLRASFGHVRDHERLTSFGRLKSVALLVLDDFGNHSFTRTAEEGFLALLEKRMRTGRRTIITSQYNAAQLGALFTTRQIADAVIRRISGEFNSIANTSDETWKP